MDGSTMDGPPVLNMEVHVMVGLVIAVVTVVFLAWMRWLDRRHRAGSDIGDIVRRDDPEGQALRRYIGRDL